MSQSQPVWWVGGKLFPVPLPGFVLNSLGSANAGKESGLGSDESKDDWGL